MKKLMRYLTIKRNILFCYIPLIYCSFAFIFLVLKFPVISAEGVRKGYQLCVNILIPSLYPFMVATEFLVMSGLLFKSNKLIYFLSDKLFGLPMAFPVYILSCLGGYPVGAECINALYKNRIISCEEGERMLVFSVNPSLNFVLSFVGSLLFKNIKVGIILYSGAILSSLILGICSSLHHKNSCKDINFSFYNTEINFPSALTSSVKKASSALFYICAFTVFFSTLAELCTTLPVSEKMLNFLVGILEVTNGVNNCYQVYPLPVISALISFGGFSAIFQVLTVTSDLKVKPAKFLMIRLETSFLSYLITAVVLKLYPVPLETFFVGTADVKCFSSHSVSVSVGLIIMTLIFLGGDYLTNYKSLDSYTKEL